MLVEAVTSYKEIVDNELPGTWNVCCSQQQKTLNNQNNLRYQNEGPWIRFGRIQ